MARARHEKWHEVERRGGAYGPHSNEVVVFDDLRGPRRSRCDALSQAAREGNVDVREMGFLPYVGPAVSSVALSLPPLLAGRQALASVFLDGVYYGAPARQPFGLFPVARRVAPDVRGALKAVHEVLEERARALGLAART